LTAEQDAKPVNKQRVWSIFAVTEKLCPFEHSDLAASCFVLGQRQALGITSPCAMSPLCATAKLVLRENADESLSLTKNALLYDIPMAALSNPLFYKFRQLIHGDHDMERSMEELAHASKEELQKRLIEANRLVGEAFSTMADLVRLNIANTAKSIEEADNAIRNMINASDVTALMNTLSDRLDTGRQNIHDYNDQLAAIARHARESIHQSTNRQMAELIAKLEHLSQKVKSEHPASSDYFEQMKNNVKNAVDAYVDFSHKAQAFFDDHQKAWQHSASDTSTDEKTKAKKTRSKK
jgi:hypothetical protein